MPLLFSLLGAELTLRAVARCRRTRYQFKLTSVDHGPHVHFLWIGIAQFFKVSIMLARALTWNEFVSPGHDRLAARVAFSERIADGCRQHELSM